MGYMKLNILGRCNLFLSWWG